MSYKLELITIRTNNSDDGIEKISNLWRDVISGRLPILFDSEYNLQPGISPVARYNNYQNDENGDYDLSILGVTSDFFKKLEAKVSEGLYKKYDVSDDNENMRACAKKAWENVWKDQKSGVIKRIFTEDYENSVPSQYTQDGKVHCYLYIAVGM